MNYLKLAIKTGFAIAVVSQAAANLEAQVYYESPVVSGGGYIQQGVYAPQEVYAPQVQTIQQPYVEQTVQPTEEQLKQLRIGANLYDNGVSPVVRSVFTNGPAQKAGLQSGDLITKVNGEASTTVGDFNAALAKMSAGDTFQLTRSRGGEEADVTISVMTLADILKASLVPEPGMFDKSIQQSESRIASLKQQIENTKLDMADLEKRLAAEEKELGELNEKAEAAAEETKKMEAEKKAKQEKEGSGSKSMEGSGSKSMEGSLKK